MLKLPKFLETNNSLRSALEAMESDWTPGEPLRCLFVAPSPQLVHDLLIARRARRVLGGFEAIAKQLENEFKGKPLHQSKEDSSENHRMHKLLFVTSDASSRLLKSVAKVLNTTGKNVQLIKFHEDSVIVGKIFFGKASPVKAFLLDQKIFVGRCLETLKACEKSRGLLVD